MTDTVSTFTDRFKDTLSVENYSDGSGYVTVTQGKTNAGWAIKADDKEARFSIAASLLTGTDSYVIDGPLPQAMTDYDYRGIERVRLGGITGEISEVEKDYFLTQARKNLALANAISAKLEDRKLEAERQERLAALAKRDKRRNELAKQLTNNTFTYLGITDSTRKAIDRIIELEEATK